MATYASLKAFATVAVIAALALSGCTDNPKPQAAKTQDPTASTVPADPRCGHVTRDGVIYEQLTRSDADWRVSKKDFGHRINAQLRICDERGVILPNATGPFREFRRIEGVPPSLAIAMNVGVGRGFRFIPVGTTS